MTVRYVITMSVIGVTVTGSVVISMSVVCSMDCIATMVLVKVRVQVFNYNGFSRWGGMTMACVASMTSVTSMTVTSMTVTSMTMTSMTVTSVGVVSVRMSMAVAVTTVAVVMT